MNNDLYLEIFINGMSYNNLYYFLERLEMRYTRDKSRISRSFRDRLVSKEVIFSKDCKRFFSERLEYGRFYLNIIFRKFFFYDYFIFNENLD